VKVIWEAKDIRGGVVMGRWDLTERWMIVYRPAPGTQRGNVFNTVSLSDGILSRDEWLVADDMASILNRSTEVPVDFLETKFAKGGLNAD
jgi:hypothetical protein